MVDPARIVSADRWVDDFTVVETENECVWIVLVIGRAFPRYASTGILDNASAFRNEPRGINAPTVYGGLANVDASDCLSRFAFLWHAREIGERGTQEVILSSTLHVAEKLLLDCAADFSQVFAKGITGIGCLLLQISRELQLFA